MDLQLEKPLPQPTPVSRPFWEALDEERILVQHCSACDSWVFYPRSHCPHCLSDDTDWIESAGKGEIYSYSVLRRGVPVPYALAYVRLDEGTTMLTNIVDCDLDALSIGQRVNLDFAATPNGTMVPVFKPA